MTINLHSTHKFQYIHTLVIALMTQSPEHFLVIYVHVCGYYNREFYSAPVASYPPEFITLKAILFKLIQQFMW